MIVDGRFASQVAALRNQAGGVGQWLSHGDHIAGIDSVEDAMARASAQPREDESPGALMLYTSGTTGSPRGVWRPLPSVAGQGAPTFAADLIALFRLDEQVRYLSTAPLYHAAPLRFALAITAVGGIIHALEKFEPEAALNAITEFGITHSQWVPTMFQRLLQLPAELRAGHSAPRHVMALHAAAPCPAAIKRAMIEWWGPVLLEYYSGTEGVGLTMIDSAQWLAHPGSVGRSVKGVPHVVDGAGHELPAGQAGTIYFSGVAPFEYFCDPQKTALRTHAAGWQTLGDVGYLDADGYLYLTDRMDDMIISGGVNVYPQEIEAAILELTEVVDCAVVGAADAQFGERPVAFVVVARGHAAEAVLERARAHCNARLGRVKQPAQFIAVESVPRTPTGKLLRRDLRASVQSMQPMQSMPSVEPGSGQHR